MAVAGDPPGDAGECHRRHNPDEEQHTGIRERDGSIRFPTSTPPIDCCFKTQYLLRRISQLATLTQAAQPATRSSGDCGKHG